jgi:hypothetical protein
VIELIFSTISVHQSGEPTGLVGLERYGSAYWSGTLFESTY